MVTHEESNKEKLEVVYQFSGISADAAQCSRAYTRGNSKGVKKNISQMINKLEKIRKRI